MNGDQSSAADLPTRVEEVLNRLKSAFDPSGRSLDPYMPRWTLERSYNPPLVRVRFHPEPLWLRLGHARLPNIVHHMRMLELDAELEGTGREEKPCIVVRGLKPQIAQDYVVM